MLVPSHIILGDALAGKYAVGAFNFNNMEFLQAIVEAAEEERSPVIVATSEGAIRYAGIGMISAMVKAVSEKHPRVPMALHLDHGKKFAVILGCIRNGYTSIMIDASHLSFTENVAETKRVVDVCAPLGISVEAELGKLQGIEDDVSVADRDAILVDPDEAKRFVELTKVNLLAPAIGTSHGAFKFKGTAKLDIARLEKVKGGTGIPLVLHGASNVPDAIVSKANKYGAQIGGAKGVPLTEVAEAIAHGICKVNVDTDLRLAFMGSIREVFAENPKEFDPRNYLGPAREALKAIVRDRIKFLGSTGKA